MNTAPPSRPTLTMPPRRSVICRTRARPSPRRAPVGEDLLVNPSVKMASRMPSGTPGPESRTRIIRFSPADTTVSSTQRGPGAWAVASIALSIRFPVTVSTAVTSVRSASTRQSPATRSWTPRSSASEDLASVSATSLGSRMAALSCSVSASRAAETSVTNRMASPYCPSSTSPTSVCIRLANSWDWARSASVRPMASSSSRLRLSDSVWSWKVTTQPR